MPSVQEIINMLLGQREQPMPHGSHFGQDIPLPKEKPGSTPAFMPDEPSEIKRRMAGPGQPHLAGPTGMPMVARRKTVK